MHRLGVRNQEIAVIHDELIQKLVLADADPVNSDAIHESLRKIDFDKLQSLSLSFQKITKIDNLDPFSSLIRLQVDNNIIQEISGIGHLTRLQWLDLSFNNITSIKGLETLVNLTDLSLFNNQITRLENLETLQKLQVLSIGNNALASTEGLLYLRCLDNLRVLNLTGNPLCQDPEYRPFVLAHLEKLQYLDYILIEDNEISQAREQYMDDLEEMREVKAIDEAARAREVEQQTYDVLLREANITILETLVSDMFKEDPEMNKLCALPGLRNLMDDFLDKAKVVTESVKLLLLEKHCQLSSRIQAFKTAIAQLTANAQQKSIASCDLYRSKVKQILKQTKNTIQVAQTPSSVVSSYQSKPLAASSPSDLQALIVAGFQDLQQAEKMIEGLHVELMGIESDIVETSQESLAALEIDVDAISGDVRTITSDHFRAIEEHENVFYDSVCQLAANLLERTTYEDAEDDDYLTEECHAILSERDALTSAINGSHDVRIGKLLAQEDLLREQNIAKNEDVMKTTREEEWSRNRSRVLEIINIKAKNLEQVAHLLEELKHLEDDFDG
uniref:Dynein regulatory complex subunit 3 n=1 Tax=Albugo laibachii Nc14 TaxID=890382 RepID=F0WRK0_9STRA|nr:conserved hypothetical protein [Albugo laibachii Nc14]|eukprot:CCA23963.1 conserved hypothetical protein [Albugo laibachii Nc14]